MKKLVELDAALEGLENLNAVSFYEANEHSKEAYMETKDMLKALPTVDTVEVVQCKDCKHNPKYEWFGCPMSHLSEAQRPETAWCWKGERKDGEQP